MTVCLFTLPVSLIGKGAPPEMIQKLAYMALCHSAKIERIDTVRAYTFGTRYFVEVCSDNNLKQSYRFIYNEHFSVT